jgi:hypothetical protein
MGDGRLGYKNYLEVKTRKYIALHVLISIVAIAVYFPGFTSSLLADDWHVISRNANLSTKEIFARYHSTFVGWYRPTFDVLVSLCFRLFGFRAQGYHLVAFFLYFLTTYLVGDLAEKISKNQTVGLLSSFLFGIHSVHAEPVLWIASMNELVAGLFVLLSLRSYINFRKSNNALPIYGITAFLYILSLTSKETSVFLPIAFVGYDLLLLSKNQSKRNRFGWHTVLINAPFFAIQMIYLTFRLSAGSPYSTAVPISRIAINSLYYFAVQVLMLPDNYGYLSSLSLWRTEPLIPVLSIGISAVAVGTLIWLFNKFKHAQHQDYYLRVMGFSGVWSLFALMPVILTATGRTAFISSMGIAWLLATLSSTIWNKVKAVKGIDRSLFAASMIMFVLTNLFVSSYRVYWWRQASQVTQSVIRQIDEKLETISETQDVCVLGLPDHLRHAYTFRNAFPYIGHILYPNYDIHVPLDTESRNSIEGTENCITYQYEDGSLKRVGVTD